MLKAMLFDMDGTLVQSANANAAAYAQSLAEHGIAVDAERIAPLIDGRSWRDFLPALIGSADVEPVVVAQRKRTLYPQFFHLLQPNAPVMDLLRAVQGRLATGLVTTASAAAVRDISALFGLDVLFDTIVSGDDVVRAKPNPEAYHLAATRLAVQPDECLVIEDSETGMAAAHAFGGTVLRWSGS